MRFSRSLEEALGKLRKECASPTDDKLRYALAVGGKVVILGIMVGGALGALCRYLVNTAFVGSSLPFPTATFIVNMAGSFLLSLLLFSSLPSLSPELKTAIGTGFLGALTTFSTFEVETFKLFDEGQWLLGLSYSLGSFLVGLVAVLLGRWVALSQNL